MTDTKGVGCGIWPFILNDTVFGAACEWHDKAYLEQSWHQLNLTREDVDKWFLKQMLLLAGDDQLLRARAYLYYTLARAAGGMWWEGDDTSSYYRFNNKTGRCRALPARTDLNSELCSESQNVK